MFDFLRVPPSVRRRNWHLIIHNKDRRVRPGQTKPDMIFGWYYRDQNFARRVNKIAQKNIIDF